MERVEGEVEKAFFLTQALLNPCLSRSLWLPNSELFSVAPSTSRMIGWSRRNG